MITRYKDGKVERIRMSFSDIPFLVKLSPVFSMKDVIDNHHKLWEAVIDRLGGKERFSVLTYQNKVVWLSIL